MGYRYFLSAAHKINLRSLLLLMTTGSQRYI